MKHVATLIVIVLLASGCAHKMRTALRASVACSMIAHAGDLSTTMFAIGRGVGKELNPILAPHVEKPLLIGVYKGGLAVAGNYPLLTLQEQHPKLTLVLSLSQCAAFSAISAHNSAIISNAKKR